jgi:serine/threonine protein kinase
MTAGPDLLLPRHTYARARALGEGSFGSVVVVYSTETGEEFAGKAFEWDDDGTISVETLRELSALRGLRDHRHPNIVRLVDVATHFEGRPCPLQIMPLHQGGDLDRLIGSGSLKPGQRLSLTRDLLRAVAFLHACGLMHRDIKPANVVLAEDGRGVLVDFSFARLFAEGGSRAEEELPEGRPGGGARRAAKKRGSPADELRGSALTGCLGTPSYIAPEVLDDEPYDETCDLWSCGVVALELLRDSLLGVERDKAALRLIRSLREKLSPKAPGCVVRDLLQEAPRERCPAAEALRRLDGAPAAGVPAVRLKPAISGKPEAPGRLLPPATLDVLGRLDGATAAARAYAAHLLSLTPHMDPRHAGLLAVKLAESRACPCADLGLHYRAVRASDLEVLLEADGCLLYAPPTGIR